MIKFVVAENWVQLTTVMFSTGSDTCNDSAEISRGKRSRSRRVEGKDEYA